MTPVFSDLPTVSNLAMFDSTRMVTIVFKYVQFPMLSDWILSTGQCMVKTWSDIQTKP